MNVSYEDMSTMQKYLWDILDTTFFCGRDGRRPKMEISLRENGLSTSPKSPKSKSRNGTTVHFVDDEEKEAHADSDDQLAKTGKRDSLIP